MKNILISTLVVILSSATCFADDDQKINSLVQEYFKSKEKGDHRWFGNNLSHDTVLKIKQMFKAIQRTADGKGEELPDFSSMSGGELYEKLVALGRGKNPNMGKPWTGAKFRLIGILDDKLDTKYAMYEATWDIDGSPPIRKVSYFKMVRDGKEWKIGLLGDIDRAIDLLIERHKSIKK